MEKKDKRSLGQTISNFSMPILLGILICVALGCFNGFMSITLNSQPMIVTLGTYPQYIAKGIIMLVSLYLSNRSAKRA